MPWTHTDYPVSMKNLRPDIRDKAVDIANALLEDGYAEGSAIPIAIAQAKKWADGDSEARNRAQLNLHVVPHPRGWAVRRAQAERASVVFETEDEARNHAILTAKDEGVDVIIHGADGQIADEVSLLKEIEAKANQPTHDQDGVFTDEAKRGGRHMTGG